MPDATSARVRERGSSPATDATELEFRRLVAGEFSQTVRLEHGDNIEIVAVGTWNREAGPDLPTSHPHQWRTTR